MREPATIEMYANVAKGAGGTAGFYQAGIVRVYNDAGGSGGSATIWTGPIRFDESAAHHDLVDTAIAMRAHWPGSDSLIEWHFV